MCSLNSKHGRGINIRITCGVRPLPITLYEAVRSKSSLNQLSPSRVHFKKVGFAN